jgi:hypothetical protein
MNVRILSATALLSMVLSASGASAEMRRISLKTVGMD